MRFDQNKTRRCNYKNSSCFCSPRCIYHRFDRISRYHRMKNNARKQNWHLQESSNRIHDYTSISLIGFYCQKCMKYTSLLNHIHCSCLNIFRSCYCYSKSSLCCKCCTAQLRFCFLTHRLYIVNQKCILSRAPDTTCTISLSCQNNTN